MTRACGDCQLCCRLLPMQQNRHDVHGAQVAMIEHGLATAESFRGMLPEFKKPSGQRCPHQRHLRGCHVYPRRPFGCRMWNCRWLVSDDTTDQQRPDRSHVVIDIMPDFVTAKPNDGSPSTTIEVVVIWVDPSNRDAWRDHRVLAYMARRGEEGKATLIRWDESDGMAVFPPAMTDDGTFHEIHGSSMQREHSFEEKIAGIGKAMRVKVGE